MEERANLSAVESRMNTPKGLRTAESGDVHNWRKCGQSGKERNTVGRVTGWGGGKVEGGEGRLAVEKGS